MYVFFSFDATVGGSWSRSTHLLRSDRVIVRAPAGGTVQWRMHQIFFI